MAKATSDNAQRVVHKRRDSIGKEKSREAGRKNTAAHRARKERDRSNLQESINLYRSLLGEPLFDFSARKKTLKGTTRPTYNPPEDMARKMTPEELLMWKTRQQLERKRLAQAKADREKREEMELLREELRAVKERYAKVFGPVAAAETERHVQALIEGTTVEVFGPVSAVEAERHAQAFVECTAGPVAAAEAERHFQAFVEGTTAQVFGPVAVAEAERHARAFVEGTAVPVVRELYWEESATLIEPVAVSEDESPVSTNEAQVQVGYDDWSYMAELLSN